MLYTIGASRIGRGVFAAEVIAAGAEILRFTGPFLRHADTTPQTLAVQVAPDRYLGSSGGADDCVNHSCDPNAGLVVRDNGNDVRLIAIRAIVPSEEICFDYSTTMDEDDFELDCQCGAAACRGRVRDFKHLTPELKRRYAELGVVPAYNLKYV